MFIEFTGERLFVHDGGLMFEAGLGFVLYLLFIWVIRFGRAFLKEEDGEDHVEAHLEELAFPVFEDGFPKMIAAEVTGKALSRPAVLAIFFSMDSPAADRLAAKKENKNKEKNDREAVVPPEAFHAEKLLLSGRAAFGSGLSLEGFCRLQMLFDRSSRLGGKCFELGIVRGFSGRLEYWQIFSVVFDHHGHVFPIKLGPG